MTDRTAATAGFVVAGIALAAALGGWPGGLGPVAAALSGAALVGLGLRRHGRLERGAVDGAAALGGVAAAAVAVGSLFGPAVVDGAAAVSPWPVVTAAAGLLVAAFAYADWLELSRSALLDKLASSAVATALGLAGLVAIVIWSVVVGGVFRSVAGEISPATGAVLSSVALGLGTASVAWLYLRGGGRGIAFIELRRPTWREAGLVVGGVAVLLGVNIAISWAFQQLGLAAAEHTIFDVARRDPSLLLVLIPLSILVIGPGEELLYRNVVQKSLYGAFSRPAAVVVASVVFAAAHVPAYSSAGATPLSVLNTLAVVFALSIVLGVAFDRTRNVLVPALIHGGFNAVAFAATYAQLVA
ncbi:MAG: lysostaphin resistance A-like protein [Halobacteriales archaeon]|nr:lysostaphin resistance A-like protein [Halobacteriales archaeon]